MSFLDDLQRWLQAHKDGRASLEGIDLERVRGVVWDAIERLGPAVLNAELHWTRKESVDLLMRCALIHLRAGPAERLNANELERALEDVLCIAAGEQARVSQHRSIVQTEVVRTATEVTAALRRDPGLGVLSRYAESLGLTTEGTVTLAGEFVLAARGSDRIALLLELGVLLSEGREDRFRPPGRLLRDLFKRGHAYDIDNDGEAIDRSLHALLWLGVCSTGNLDHDPFVLEDDAENILRSVVDVSPNTSRAMARAALDELRIRSDGRTMLEGSTSDLRTTAMMLHEVKNVLLPLSSSLGRLWTELDGAAPDPTRVAELRGRITRSVERLQDFTAESASLIAAVPVETLSLAEVVRDAVRATEPDRNGRIQVDLSGLLDGTIEGARTRWVLLFVNLLRNAAQSRAGKGTVWIAGARTTGGSLIVHVDDDGAGVPEELREQIFARGVSLKGGSGLGLADARFTVQQSGGTLVCASSPRGGARFTLTVPVRSAS